MKGRARAVENPTQLHRTVLGNTNPIVFQDRCRRSRAAAASSTAGLNAPQSIFHLFLLRVCHSAILRVSCLSNAARVQRLTFMKCRIRRRPSAIDISPPVISIFVRPQCWIEWQTVQMALTLVRVATPLRGFSLNFQISWPCNRFLLAQIEQQPSSARTLRLSASQR